jgi:hypothetical protein
VDRRAEAEESARRDKRRAVRVYHDDDGMVVIRGRLAPEVGALLERALEAARETLYRRTRGEARPMDPAQDVPTFEQQQADALALLAETALHHELDPGASGERYQVVVHVEAPVLGDPDQPGQSVLEDGVRVPAGTSQRLACDASRVVMRHDEAGRLLEIGARTRTIPPALRRALHCRRHHRTVHEEGYTVERQPDGTLRFRRPDGRILPDVPPPAAVPADPVRSLRATHVAQGLHLHARTAMPGWLEERLNVGLCHRRPASVGGGASADSRAGSRRDQRSARWWAIKGATSSARSRASA